MEISAWIWNEKQKNIKKRSTIAVTKNPDRESVVEPLCSKLAYNPDRRWEVWRLVTYAFMHANRGKPTSIENLPLYA